MKILNRLKQDILLFVKKHKRALLSIFVATTFTFASGFTSGYTGKYPELIPLLNLLSFFVNLIRFGSAGIAGVIATISGWNIVTNTNGQGIKSAKSNISRLLLGITIVFFGSTAMDFLLDKVIDILI